MLVFVRVSIPLSIYWNVPPVYIWMPKRADSSEHLPVFCCEPAASGDHSTFDPAAIFSNSFGWVSLSVSPPLWWDQIRIKAAKTEQDQMCSPSQKLLIEWICICCLSASITNVPPFIYVKLLRYAFRACSLKVPPFNRCRCCSDAVLKALISCLLQDAYL